MLPPESAGLDLAPHHRVALLALLERHVPDAEVWAFGSRVGGGAHEGSDLDLVLRNPQDPSAPVAGWSDLVDALQDSALPMLVDVHDWSRLPVDFREGIERRYAVVRTGRQRDGIEQADGQVELGHGL